MAELYLYYKEAIESIDKRYDPNNNCLPVEFTQYAVMRCSAKNERKEVARFYGFTARAQAATFVNELFFKLKDDGHDNKRPSKQQGVTTRHLLDLPPASTTKPKGNSGLNSYNTSKSTPARPSKPYRPPAFE